METLLENLVALMYLPANSRYPEVVPVKNLPELEIDLKNNTWLDNSHMRHPLKQPPKKIGEYNHFMKEFNRGVIGVYDRSKTEHLSSMVRDWHSNHDTKNTNWNFVD